MTAHTGRNSTRKFGFFGRASARPGGPDRQSQDGRDVPGFDGYGPLLANHGGYPNQAGHEPSAIHMGFAGDAGHDGHSGHAGDAGREPQPSGKAEEYTGRHARKRRVGKIVPAVAVAAVVAGGGAVYGLASGGHSQAKLSATTALSATVDSAARADTADAAGVQLITVGKATGVGAREVAWHTDRSFHSHRPAAAPPAAPPASAPGTQESAPATQAHAPYPYPSPSATPTQRQPAAGMTLSCNQGSGLLPQNVSAIVSFLLANGYSDNAAAGIAGNIYQESKGDPESVGDGGGGLIGFTPLPAGYVTGNPTADLQTQLAAVLTFNQNDSSDLPALDSADSPSDAADIYVTDFERAGIPVTATREESAEDVASACGI